MKRLSLILILILTLFVNPLAGQAAGQQCPGGVCVPPSSPSRMAPAARPPAYACRIVNHTGASASYGSGAVVCVGSDYGAVLTCWHVFRGGVGRIAVTLPDGKTYQAKLAAQDERNDLAMLKITPRPEVAPIKIATDFPRQGERLTFAGYGSDGRYRTITGALKGYRNTTRNGRHQTLVVSGGARGGDSGGPILNARGELVGVLWGTDGLETVGSYNGVVHTFTSDDRFLFPWNADLAGKKNAQRYGGGFQTQPIAPVAPSDPSLGGRVAALETQVASLRGVADEARRAGLLAGADAKAAKDDASSTANVAEEAKAEAAAAAGQVKELEGGLADRLREKASGVVGGLLSKYGLAALGIGGGGIGLLFWLMKKDILDKVRTGDPLLISKLAARTPWGWDDRLLERLRDVPERVTERIPGEWDDRLLARLVERLGDRLEAQGGKPKRTK